MGPGVPTTTALCLLELYITWFQASYQASFWELINQLWAKFIYTQDLAAVLRFKMSDGVLAVAHY